MRKGYIPSIILLGSITLFATSYVDVEKVCAVCGEKSKQTVLVSTNSSGSSDLDMRPPEMMRSTIAFWVEQCPACGYCANDIGKLIKNAKDTMADPSYKTQLSNAEFPELANKFLCRMQIQEKAGEFRAAIYSAICAGWASDDANNAAAAFSSRTISIQRLLDFNGNNEMYVSQKGGDEVLISDMLRRNGEFEKARQIADKGIGYNPENVIKDLLAFELALIDKKDTAVHKVAEAVNADATGAPK